MTILNNLGHVWDNVVVSAYRGNIGDKVGRGRRTKECLNGLRSDYEGRLVLTARGNGTPKVILFDHKYEGKRPFPTDSGESWTNFEASPGLDKITITRDDGARITYESSDRDFMQALAASNPLQKSTNNTHIVDTKYLDLPGYGNLGHFFRVHFLLVAEGLKPMAWTGDKDRESMLSVLDAAGLPYSNPEYTEERGFYGPGFGIRIYRDMETETQVNENSGENGTERWKNQSKLLGYPSCCVDSWVDGIQGVGSRLKRLAGLPRDRFDGQILRELKRTGTYPDHLNYKMHTPCDIECEETRRVGTAAKQVLEKYDPEAADYMKEELIGPINRAIAHSANDAGWRNWKNKAVRLVNETFETA